MQFEVEQKFQVDEIAALVERLLEVGAVEQRSVVQIDCYFNHPARDFAKTDEALRLRSVGEANFITYKGPKLDAVTKTRREIELPLSPGSVSIVGYAQLLAALGFRFVAEVRKTRRVLKLAWEGHTVEIALDNVAGLGTYVELEISADESSVEAAKSSITSLATVLELNGSERRSYLELLLEKRTATGH